MRHLLVPRYALRPTLVDDVLGRTHTCGRAALRRMAELRLSGYSLQQIADIVVAEALAPGDATRGLARQGASRVHRILQNPLYVGRFEWRGETWPGSHEPVFTEGEWQELQRTFGEHAPPQARHDEGALTGFLVCAECGCRVTWDPKRAGERFYPDCRCANGKRAHARLVYAHERDLLRQFGEALDAIVIPAPLMREVLEALRAELVRDGESAALRDQDREQELARLRQREDRVVDDLYDERIPREVAERQLARIAEERRRLETAKAAGGGNHWRGLCPSKALSNSPGTRKIYTISNGPTNSGACSKRYFRIPACAAEVSNMTTKNPSDSSRKCRRVADGAP
jgi:hypothetical protein